MKSKLNDAQARAYIAGDQSEPAQEIERKHILGDVYKRQV